MVSLHDNLSKMNKLLKNKAFVDIVKIAVFVMGIVCKFTDILGLWFQKKHCSGTWMRPQWQWWSRRQPLKPLKPQNNDNGDNHGDDDDSVESDDIDVDGNDDNGDD